MKLKELLAQFSENTVLLTPNRRLSNFLNDKANELKIREKQTAWPSVKTLPFIDWLQQLWLANTPEQLTLLSNAQMEFLWRDIISKDSDTPELLNLEATVKQAIDAMRRLVLWQIPIKTTDFFAEPDWRQFYLWHQAYVNYCSSHQLTDSVHLPLRLLTSIETIVQKSLLKKIIISGFDEIPPLWQRFLDALSPICEIRSIECTELNAKKARYEFTHFRDELHGMIQWTKHQYEENPNQTIACIIPSLAKKRSTIEKEFIKAFAPHTFLKLADKDEMPFNISAGQALSEFEIINTAMRILQLSKKFLTMKTIRFLLRNTFIVGYYKEFSQRAGLEIRLAKLQTYSISDDFFLRQLQEYCPILALAFQSFLNIECKPTQSLLKWVEHFNQKLEVLGWPGDRELSSQNYQLVLRMKASFDELFQFDGMIKECNESKALELFQKLTNDTVFQVKTPKQNLQILGSLEAAGMAFDKIWIMELNDKQWPAVANPSPYIPHRLQREYQLPHANAERELQFSQTLLGRYFQSAKEVYMSYAKEDGEQEFHCSTLIENISLENFTLEHHDLIDEIAANYQPESWIDNQAPAISDSEMTNIHGGTQLLALQAACPFRSFATHRLQARNIPEHEPGLTALERGKIIHAALDLFWQQIKNQKNLLALDEEKKQDIISSVVYAAVISIDLQLHIRAPKLFKLELERVKKLINKWLELETQRSPFTVIATEQALQTNLAGLPLKLRMDRIDQLDNGAVLLIDYKSSIISINRWFGERLDEPQLPLYALIYPETVDAILFGQIKVNEFAIKGIGNLDATGFGVKNIADLDLAGSISWEQQKQQWKTELEKLAVDFLNGVAEVDPKNGNQTCQFCDLTSLCRINENNDYVE